MPLLTRILIMLINQSPCYYSQSNLACQAVMRLPNTVKDEKPAISKYISQFNEKTLFFLHHCLTLVSGSSILCYRFHGLMRTDEIVRAGILIGSELPWWICLRSCSALA
jgi:hypothetical protein